LVLDEYVKLDRLGDQEIASLPLLIEAAYAAYYLQSSLLVNKGDETTETVEWQGLSEEMLNLIRGN
jgi:hypothetical protein